MARNVARDVVRNGAQGTPWAPRMVSLLVGLGALAVLLYYERDTFFTAPPQEAENTPFLQCLAERKGDIHAMEQDGTIDAAQASLFAQRAEALCRDLFPTNP